MTKQQAHKKPFNKPQKKAQAKGRPTRYNRAIHPDIAKKSGLLLGDKDKVAEFLGISKTTLYAWEKSHREFKQAIDEAIIQASSEVAKSLFDIARGGFVKKTTKTRKYKMPVKDKDKDTEKNIEIINDNDEASDSQEIIEVTEIEETLPPNYKAIEFWLRNKNNWKTTDTKEELQAQDKSIIIMPAERFK